MVVFIKKRGETVKKPLDSVVAFYAEDKYVMVHFDNGDTDFLYGLSDERGGGI